ncbi:TadE/TadG family type IV pilus assembly protein [Actinomadura sp. HBU206391]|uniref:TadE/TadG family type IV pilus assembly protein n=1 Tax=Actinomadura sp. HBU206391 TaxID=2731692 RepID=UPI0016501F75|nr:TadE family protein [Actinomadura sp. HBU206391]MBC6461871.1 pilus assembly protein [Actinomadura sp. HBU206391]
MKDKGSAAVEYLSTIGLFLFVLVVCIEAYVSFSTIEKVENAARTGARTASMAENADGREAEGRAAADAAMPDWINSKTITVTEIGVDSVQCTIRAKVPLLAKGVPFDFTVTRRVEMPVG